jgi:glycosyltransferase involved in cell wall biosynthesis
MNRNDRKDLLFLSQVLPFPLDSGPKIRAYYTLRTLARRFNVTVVAIVNDEKYLTYVDHLETFCERVVPVLRRRSFAREFRALLTSFISNRPLMIVRHYDGGIDRTVSDLLSTDHICAVHVDQLKMAQFVEGNLNIPRVIDKHNAYADVLHGVATWGKSILIRLLATWEWPRLAAYEGELCRQFDKVIAVSEIDGAVLSEWAGEPIDLSVIPIALDPGDQEVINRNPDAKDIVCVGSMHYPPNEQGALWFVEQVFPIITRAFPETRLLLIGGKPTRRIQNLGTKDARIEVTGYVEDLQPYLESSAVFVAPIHFGSGTRVKILDALAKGMPIVSTSFGCMGLEVTDSKDILLADTAEAFASAVIRLLHDRKFAESLASHGRRTIEERYDWRKVYRKLDEIYDQLGL